jgi:hypothetical protein
LDCGDDDESDELGCYTNNTVGESKELTCANNGSLLCEHNCTDFKQGGGFFCSCHRGFRMLKLNISTETNSGSSDAAMAAAAAATVDSSMIHRHTCVDIDECELFDSHCPQRCTNTKGSYKCSCVEDHVDSHGDGTICDAEWQEAAIVLIAHGTEIRQLRTNYTDYAYTNLIEGDSFILAIDVDPLERHVYWIDETRQQIRRAFIPHSKAALAHPQTLSALAPSAELIAANDLTALCVDWLAKNLYFANSRNHSIYVARSDGRYAKTLLTRHAHTVYSIACNPIIG